MRVAKSLLLLVPTLLLAQPAAKERIQVTLIEIPVNVVDRDGNPVRGLSRENFEVIDEGKKREIAHFEMIDLQRLPAETAGTPLNPAARRNFLLLFDLSNSTPASILRSREAAGDFILNRLGSQDLAAVATYSVEKGFRVITSFTFDRPTLRQAIDTLGHPKFFQATDPLLIAALPNLMTSSKGGSPRIDEDAIQNELAEQARVAVKNDEEYRRGRVRRQIGSLASLARILDSIRGRKQVILLSEGFDASLVQGRDSSASAEAMRETEAVVSGEIWNVDSDARFGSASGTNQLSDMGDLFKRSDVVLHAFDIKGLRGATDVQGGTRSAGSTVASGSGQPSGRSSTESLFLMSNQTGGQLFKNANDLRENFDKLLRQQEAVYILGFQAPSSGTAGKFHNLKVRLRDVPGGARVSHRAGYYEPDDKVTPVERSLELVEILMNDIPQEQVDINLLVAPFPTAADLAQVPVVLEIAGPGLIADTKGNALAAEIFVYAFDADNVVRDFLHQKASFDLSKVGDALRKSGVKYYGVLSLPIGEYIVKSLVRVAGTERTGFARTPLRVADFKKSAVLPPLFLEEGENWIMIKAAPRRPSEVDYPFVIGAESFVPSVEPRLQSEGTYKLALVTYNIPAEALQLSATVEGEGAAAPAKIALTGRTPPDAMNGTRYLLSFSPQGLAPGSYALRVAVKQKDASGSHQVSVPFTVQ